MPILLLSFVFLCDASEISRDRLRDAGRLINEGLYKDAEAILIARKQSPETLFLLGRLYKEKGSFEKAEVFLRKSIEGYPLLKDYALISLAELYLTYGHFAKAIETIRTIKTPLLRQDAEKIGFNALIAMGKEDKAVGILSRYVKEYPDDTEARFLLATLYKDKMMKERAIRVFKDIYIMASELADDAFTELKDLKADSFTKEELMKRAENLFDNSDYQGAKETYEGLLKLVDEDTRERIWYEIGRCQFRLKQYVEATESFKKVRGSEALYWQARSLFRIDDREGFDRIVESFGKQYPQDIHLARLLLMSADDLRRKEDLKRAREEYNSIVKMFPQKEEEALWGLGWMYYSTDDYDKALEYFSRLKNYKDSTSYNKYLYWWLRTCERVSQGCRDSIVHDIRPSVDNDYYGYLVWFRYSNNKVHQTSIKSNPSPARPHGEAYDRIDALALLGLREWAIREIRDAISRPKSKDEFIYLCNMARMMGDYKTVIALNEEKEGEEYLAFSYPLGYWETVEMASESNNLDPYLVAALIREESRFDSDAVSWAGAIGLMQLMPATASRFSDTVDRGSLQDVDKNISIGSSYLSMLIKEFNKLPYAIAAYNAGENAVKGWLEKDGEMDIDEFVEDIPYRETRRYVKKVLKSYWQYRGLYGLPVEGFNLN